MNPQWWKLVIDKQVMGVYQRKLKLKSDDKDIRAEAGETQEELTSDWMMSLINTMRADMDSDKLYPPGDVYIMVSEHERYTPNDELKKRNITMSLSRSTEGEGMFDMATRLSAINKRIER